MSNGRSTSRCHSRTLAVALAGITFGFALSAWAAEPPAGAAASPAAGAIATSNVPTTEPAGAKEKWAFLNKYCSKCHNTQDWAGGIAFDSLTPDTIPDDAETWEKAVRKLRAGL